MKRRSFVTGATVAAAGLTLVSQKSDAATTSSGRYVNVMDFGAVGDGVHDDTAAIQSAVSSLAANGGGVYFPPGAYAVSSTINPVANMAISGFGAAATKILPKTAGMRLFECNAGSAQMVNISISNLEIDAGSVTGVTGIYFTFCYNVAIQNITFSGCDYTVQLDRCRYVELNNCISRGGANRAGTLKLFSGSVTDYIHEVKIRDYQVINIGNGVANGHAILVHRGVGVLIEGYLINDGHVAGDVRAVAFYGDCQGCKVSNSEVGACESGIFFGNDIFFPASTITPTFINIANVDVDQPQQAGIFVQAASWITVTGGNFTSSGANVSACGMLLQGGGKFTIEGAMANGFSSGNGILIGAGVSNVIVAQCRIDQCQTGIGVVAGSGRYLSLMGNILLENTNPIIFGANGGSSLVRNNIGIADIS